MVKLPEPANEKERLAALKEYQFLEAEAGKEFEEITQLASEICQARISMITLIDSEKQWIKAGLHLPVDEIPSDIAFCSHAIHNPYEPMVVPDLSKDKRFSDQPFVLGETRVVFYAGVPLTNPDGYSLGALCVLDEKPRTLTDNQLRSLQTLAKQVIQLLELRKANIKLKSLKENLESRNEELQQFAYVVSHDIKSPLASIVLTGEMLRENFGESIDEDNDQLLKVLNRASFKIKNLVDGILAYYRAEKAMSENAESFLLKPFLHSIVEMLRVDQKATIKYPEEEHELFMNKTALEQILVNLLQNAFKYNDKEKPHVGISFSEDEKYYYFTITDNGRGIAAGEQEKIFELFTTLGEKDRFGTKGTGIGLSTVKKLVGKMSGKISLKSTPGEGAEFSFYLKK